jgi:primosomal protein N'
VRFLIRSVLHQGGLCGPEEECPDRVFRCRRCGYSAQTELDACPRCGADWKAIDVSHGPGCPKNLLEEAMDTPNGALVRRCFRVLNAKNIGLTITLADITEEEFRVLELIEIERQEQVAAEGSSAQNFQELLLRRLSRQ